MFCLNLKCKTYVISVVSFILGCLFTLSFVSIEYEDNTPEETDGNIYGSKESHEKTKLFSSVNYFLIVVIISSAENGERRTAIRESWSLLTTDRTSIQYYFVIGSEGLSDSRILKLKNEQIKYNDIFLFSVPDNYESLTRKVLSAFVWFDKEFNFSFLLKCDDDSFVNVPRIVYELENKFMNTVHLYWGFFDGRANVKRAGKWNEKEWFLCDKYLPYALGGGYVLSQSLVHFIASNEKMLSLYNSEDVSLGVWLAPLNITRKHDTRFDTEYLSRGCSNKYLITHKQSSSDMYNKYRLLKAKGKLCDNEVKVRKSYEYNWKGPPSQCCIRNDSVEF